MSWETLAAEIEHRNGRQTVPSGSMAGLLRIAALSLCYLALHLALERLSFFGALHGVGITPWTPSAGLALALLIVKGPIWAPLVMVAEIGSGFAVPVASVSATTICLASLVVAAGCAGIAAILRGADLAHGIRRSRQVVLFLVAVIFGSGLIAGGYVAVYAGAGVVPWSGFAEAGFHFWIGDAVGMVVLVPPLIALYGRVNQPAARDRVITRPLSFEAAAQGASIVIALAAVFSGVGGDHPLGLFYLLFPPLIWIAMRHGLFAASGAVLAIQSGLITGLVIQGHPTVTLRAIQLLMLALAATGLMLGAVVDERRRLSEELAESERRRTAILNTARDGVLTIDGNGRIQSINPAVERLFSRSRDQLIGHDVAELVEDGPNLLRRLKLAAGPLGPEQDFWELTGRRPSAGSFPIELSVGQFERRGTERYTIVVRDITLRRRAEAQAREHQAELARVSRVSLAGEMAAGLAHELSQPLTAITAYARGCLRLLAAPAAEPSLLHEGVSQVVREAERAGAVLGRLREFVRGGDHRRIPTDIDPLIDTALSLVQADAARQGVALRKELEPELPAVLADPVQIEQVLLNLLRNAMDALSAVDAERRSIVVAAGRKSGGVAISVTDAGPGIAAEMMDAIFEPFVTTKSNGMGMGLSISRSIVEWHGGRLRAASTGSGATLAFDLPAADLEAADDA